MIKVIVLSLFLLTKTSIVLAKEINIEVKGMVCEFCVSTIEKNLKKQKEVKNTKIDMKQKKVYIEFKKGKNISDKRLKKIIIDNGYNVEKINR